MNVEDIIATADALGPTPLPPEIASYEDEQDPEVRGGWEITTQTSADWALQRRAECEAEAERVEDQYQAALARLTKRRDDLIARAKRGAAFFEFKVKVWAERNRASLLKGKSKSVPLLHGVVGWRKKGGNLKVVDRDALEAWLLAQGVESGLFRLKVEPEMREIQARLKRDGEIPPGCEYVPEFDDVYVKSEAPETALMKGE